jgi:DNA-binding response OmpR family regulator
MKILVAEDEAAIREVEAAYLNKAGYDTMEAADGQEALAIFDQHGADLVIVDVNMPLVDGLEVCRRIRQRSNVPIIIVTAKDGDDDELRGLEVGADDYIKKPFNPNVLLARSQRLLQRHKRANIVRGALVIDPLTMGVTKHGAAVSLTTTQFNILLTLAAQPEVVFSRTQLIDSVYSDPAGHAIYDRTIDAHIKSIRKAIEDDPNHPQYVQTVIGRGYRFGAQGS